MKLIDRYKKPTPTFFRKLRNIGIALAATGGAILAAPIFLDCACDHHRQLSGSCRNCGDYCESGRSISQ